MMKQIFLLTLSALALAANLKAASADEAAMAALYPQHETFFQNELHPVERAVQPPQKIEIISIDVFELHVSGFAQ